MTAFAAYGKKNLFGRGLEVFLRISYKLLCRKIYISMKKIIYTTVNVYGYGNSY